jgi:SAM-dependent methyltransferase
LDLFNTTLTHFNEVTGQYDVVLFSVSLHHMTDLEGAVKYAHGLLPNGGHLLCYEPCHDRFTHADASVVGLMRDILSLTGHWYDTQGDRGVLFDETWLEKFTTNISWNGIKMSLKASLHTT